jgi:hypothetical protein
VPERDLTPAATHEEKDRITLTLHSIGLEVKILDFPAQSADPLGPSRNDGYGLRAV